MGRKQRLQSLLPILLPKNPQERVPYTVPGTVCLAPTHPSFSELAPVHPKLCPGVGAGGRVWKYSGLFKGFTEGTESRPRAP